MQTETKKDLSQIASWGGYIGYVVAAWNYFSAAPLWVKILVVIIGLVALAVVLYGIDRVFRMKPSELDDLRGKAATLEQMVLDLQKTLTAAGITTASTVTTGINSAVPVAPAPVTLTALPAGILAKGVDRDGDRYVEVDLAKFTGDIKLTSSRPANAQYKVYYGGAFQDKRNYDEDTNTLIDWRDHSQETTILKYKVVDAFVKYIQLHGPVDWKGVAIGSAITGAQYDEVIKPWVMQWAAAQNIMDETTSLKAFILQVQADEKHRQDEIAVKAAFEQAARDKQYAETMERAKSG